MEIVLGHDGYYIKYPDEETVGPFATTEDANNIKELSEYITNNLKALTDPEKVPNSTISLGFWMAINFSIPQLAVLDIMSKTLPKSSCNKWLVRAMTESGQYKSEDGEAIEAK